MISLLLVFGCQLSTSNNINPTAYVGDAEIGKATPDFTLQDLEGQTVTLSDLRGSPVMLNFWASWCGWCVVEMPYIQQIYDEWQDRGLVILAINKMETPATAQAFMESNGFSFIALLDRDGSVSLNYNVQGIPVTFFIDKGGIIQEKRLGAFSNTAEIEYYLDSIIP